MTSLIEQTLLPDDASGSEHSDLESLIVVLSGGQCLTLNAGDRSVEVPDALRGLLLAAVTNLMSGTAVTISPHRTSLTTQEAADILGVTRPTLVRLLTAGEIPYTRPGRHRRVQLADVLAYQQRLRQQRTDALNELAVPEPGSPVVDGFVTTR